jgi:hypothetical protein
MSPDSRTMAAQNASLAAWVALGVAEVAFSDWDMFGAAF